MDGTLLSVSAAELYANLGTASAPILVDVRRQDAFDADDRMIIGAIRRAPGDVDQWSQELPLARTVAVYCSHGGEVSQGVGNALRDGGVKAAYLEGGISAWQDTKLPTRRKLRGKADNKWVTREHPKIDRIACPWLVSRFINPGAEFIYVPPDQVTEIAEKTGGIPYDIKGADSGTWAIAAPSMRSSASLISRTRPWIASPRSSAARTPRGVISHVNARGFTQYRSDFREFPRRPRNAASRVGDLRRALHLVSQSAGRGSGAPSQGPSMNAERTHDTRSPLTSGGR
jgi:rhodanese-related sulfurtransferase